MRRPTLHYTWRWNMPAPPQRVWPLVSDTNAFNRAVGIGPWTFTETPDPAGGSIREGSARSLGGNIWWDEKPFQWVEGREFSVLRVYKKGPFLQVLTRLELEPEDSGCILAYTIDAVPRSTLWETFARYYLGVHTRRRFNAVFGTIASHLAGDTETAYPRGAPDLSRAARHRLRSSQSSLAQAGFEEDVVRRLTRHIELESDEACDRIKPYALADEWGAGRLEVLTLCLHATRLGLLELAWNLMCPLCRGPKGQASSLSELRHRGHCTSCNIEFDANFDRSVEVTFRPSQRIRECVVPCFCVGGPGNTPHVMLQQSIASGESQTTTVGLAEGVYRIRGPQMTASALLEVRPSPSAPEEVRFTCSGAEVVPGSVEIAPGPIRLVLQNADTKELLVILERLEWPDDAVTAAQVTALQDFRDLFSSEVLAPEEQFQVRHLTFMFTDLRASTTLYRERGDAPAFALVRDHFGVLREQVTGHQGAVVKTIGDAVMAVFVEPGDAVAAALDIHGHFDAQSAEHRGIVLKIGVHAGPCIAVNLNGRPDYFGTTVNTAVRLESLSLGGDIVILSSLLDDPTVHDVLEGAKVRVEQLTAELKGFQESFEICRVKPAPTDGRTVD